MSVRRCRPDIRVDVPVPGDLVFVSSCLVSLIFYLVEKKTVITKCAITLKRIPRNIGSVNAQNSRQCHICELLNKSFVQKM
ncbi:hypothetical protein CJP72_06450 [Citrobacter sp. NCU1]|nr:hypothetical protein [Citrobacter sp. NCU1]